MRLAEYHETYRVMTKGDHEGQIFLSHPHTNNGYFFFLTIGFLFLNKLPEVSECAEMQYHMMMSF